MKTKKEKLRDVKQELQKSCPNTGYVKQCGDVFFRLYDYGCVMTDLVYSMSVRVGVDFNLLSMDGYFFVGTLEYAKLLQSKYGGRVCSTVYSSYAENAKDLWTWEGIKMPTPLNYEEVFELLIN